MKRTVFMIWTVLWLGWLGNTTVCFSQIVSKQVTRLSGTIKMHFWLKLPVAFSNDIKGGHHQVETIADMYAIPSERREKGMLCTVLNDGGKNCTYQLLGGTDNSYWKVFVSGQSTVDLMEGNNTGEMRYWDQPNSSWTIVPVGNSSQLLQLSSSLVPTWSGLIAPLCVTTSEVTAINKNTAKSGGFVVSSEGISIDKVGVCWSKTNAFPTIVAGGFDGFAEKTGGLNGFDIDISSLYAGNLYYLRAYAKASGGGVAYGNPVRTFTTLGSNASIPVVNTATPTVITKNSADLGGEVSFDGNAPVLARGICWNTGGADPVLSEHPTLFSGSTGPFLGSVSGFTPGMTYHVRAYVTNAIATTYGAEKVFTTLDASKKPPSGVFTDEPTNINKRSVTCGGRVTNYGAIAAEDQGLCYNTKGDPSYTDQHISCNLNNNPFSTSISLQPGTKYYMKAYVNNLLGICYGAEKSFITLADNATAPVNVVTAVPTDLSSFSATCGGSVAKDGGAPILERGICWTTRTTGNPNINDNPTTVSGTWGSFTHSLNNLSEGQTYHVKAYARNILGITYGQEEDFIAFNPVVTDPVFSITAYTAKGGGGVSGLSGNPRRGICWCINTVPTVYDAHCENGTGNGSFTCDLTELQGGTPYRLRAYAICDDGTVCYGKEERFITSSPTPVTTSALYSISNGYATGGGGVYGLSAILIHGIIYSTTSNNLELSNTDTFVKKGGQGNGPFTVVLDGLQDGKTYYVKAFATSDFGSNTQYGDVKSFKAIGSSSYSGSEGTGAP